MDSSRVITAWLHYELELCGLKLTFPKNSQTKCTSRLSTFSTAHQPRLSNGRHHMRSYGDASLSWLTCTRSVVAHMLAIALSRSRTKPNREPLSVILLDTKELTSSIYGYPQRRTCLLLEMWFLTPTSTLPAMNSMHTNLSSKK